MKTKEKQEQRSKLITDARALIDTAEKENRDLNAEEQKNYDKMIEDATKYGEQITRDLKLADLERSALETRGGPRPGETASAEPSEAVMKAFPSDKLRAHYRTSPRVTEKYALEFRRYLETGSYTSLLERGGENPEYRDLDATVGTSAAFLRAPIQMVQTLIKKVDDLVFIRGLATKYQVPQAATLGVPTLTANADDADWTSELATGSNDAGLAFGRRELHPQPLAKRIKLSNTLLRTAVMDAETIVLDRLAYSRGITQEKAFMTGVGVKTPLGVFTASADGISTGRDVTCASTTAIAFDDIVATKYNQKQQYWPRLRWIFHRDALKKISQLKDGDGQYLWQPSRQVGQPDTLLEFPFMMSEYAPNTFTTGLYVGLLGDFSYYWIADSLDLQIQRLVELYAETNQTGFITRQETDGMPVLEEAFSRMKLA
jgi:HK97 family phage major capsid protein